MIVRDRMTSNPCTISPDTTAGDLWHFMTQNDLRRVPVVDRGKLVAMVTRRDFGARDDLNLRHSSLATRFFTDEQEEKLNKIKVRDIIPVDQQLITIHQDAYIEQAAKILRDNKISGLPVIDDNGKLVGIITQSDVSDAFLDIFGVNQKGTRICLGLSTSPGDLLAMAEIFLRHNAKIGNLVMMESKDDKQLMIVRVDSLDSRSLVNDLKEAGFKVESVITKQ
ncbi:MAG: CBS and ACT domain-containing protein [Syntrophomonas sp.]